MSYIIIPGNRFSSNLLYVDNFIYKIKSKYGDSVEYYNCKTTNCPSRLKLEHGIITERGEDHNHDDDGKEYLKIMFKSDIKKKLREFRMSPRECFDLVAKQPE